MTLLLSPLSSRGQLGGLLNEKRLTGAGAEVGVHRGAFALGLLETWTGRLLHLIDPWSNPPGYHDLLDTERDGKMVDNRSGGWDRDWDYDCCRRRLADHVHRCVFHRVTSAEAVRDFRPGQLDFVTLDADHRATLVLADLTAWWPVLRPGGLLAVHDWLCPGPTAGWGQDVQAAVSSFLYRLITAGRPPVPEQYLIAEEGGLPWTLYFFKPEEAK